MVETGLFVSFCLSVKRTAYGTERFAAFLHDNGSSASQMSRAPKQ
jgi:hypothetical protein